VFLAWRALRQVQGIIKAVIAGIAFQARLQSRQDFNPGFAGPGSWPGRAELTGPRLAAWRHQWWWRIATKLEQEKS
jgi:hypothetical protein